MIISAAIVSKEGKLYFSNILPEQLQTSIKKHASDFIYALRIADDEIEFPYIETTKLRYVYKQTADLYWLLVTRLESEMFSDIHLLGKFICTIMEYGSSDTNSQTITDEQCDLFYRHIWRPWDDDTHCPYCGCQCNHSSEYWEREFDNRLQFLINIRDGHVDDNDAIYFSGLIDEAWAISARLSPKWNQVIENPDNEFVSDNESVLSTETEDRSISEETVIDGCRLKCRLEDIRIEIGRIQDPYLRLFAKRNLLTGLCYIQNNQLCSAPTLKELDSNGQNNQSILFDKE